MAKVISVTLTPDPPVKGQDLKVDADIELCKQQRSISESNNKLLMHVFFRWGNRQW